MARAPALVEDAVARTFGVELVLPPQLPLRHSGPIGPRALLARLLYYALVEAGWAIDGRTGWHRMPAHSGA